MSKTLVFETLLHSKNKNRDVKGRIKK